MKRLLMNLISSILKVIKFKKTKKNSESKTFLVEPTGDWDQYNDNVSF